MVHHDRFTERERKVRVAVLDVADIPFAVLVERLPAFGVLVVLAGEGINQVDAIGVIDFDFLGR